MELWQYLHNTVRTETDPDGFTACRRFLEEQLPAYRYNSMYRYMSQNSAGVCLRLWTDAVSLSLECRTVSGEAMAHQDQERTTPYQTYEEEQRSRAGRRFQPREGGNRLGTDEPYGMRFDCCAGGRLMDSRAAQNGTITFRLENPLHAMREVVIHFPHLVPVRVRNLQADGRVEPVAERPRLLFLGDSITQGLNAVHPSRCYTAQVAEALHCDWLNQGVAGYVFWEESLAGLERLPFQPERVVVAFGTNDWEFAGSLRQIRQSAERYFRRLCQLFQDRDILVITPWWRDDETLQTVNGPMQDWREWLASTAGAYPQVRVLSGETLMPHDVAYFQDGFLHPNDEGASWMAQRLLEEW